MNNEKLKKRIMKGISRMIERQKGFKHITKHTGRGPHGYLKRLHVVDDNNKSISIKIGKEKIENHIIK